MSGVGRVTAGLVVAVALPFSSCGTSTPVHRADTGVVSPSPSSSPAPLYIAVIHDPGTGQPSVEIVSTDGAVVASVAAPNGSGTRVVGTGAHGVYMLDAAHVLKRLAPNGDLTTLGPVSVTDNSEVAGLAESPDGGQWIYSVATYANDLSATSRIYVGSPGRAPRLVATLTRPNQIDEDLASGYEVLRWDRQGVLLGTAPTNVGGVAPFIGDGYELSIVVRMDLASGALSAPLAPHGCRFGDIAADGTVACADRAARDIRLIGKDGSIQHIRTGAEFFGGIGFLPGTTSLAFLTTLPPGDYPWTDALHVYDPAARSRTPRTVVEGVDPGTEYEHGFDAVVDADTIAVIMGPASNPKLSLVKLSTGVVSRLSPATYLLGVLPAG
jgi:hypothetical protein